MAHKTAHELIESARRFRDMANVGDDPVLKALLLQLADEFDLEATSVVAAAESVDNRQQSRQH